ncbi:LytR C-terminal domain-containing protein [Pedococcus sp. 5OH_020]|uniref:LytR C-terminal domain-containing protein n=1 Tax=Pedococcus sp. 5OH_020 TaxID=2989814 RepID=UPI0022EA0F7E|nr:LytR C-terminal domain-containing protein [Pedococcus sp. 5OH_020]
MSYIVESGASTSRRARRRRTLVTLAVVTLMLFFAFWYAYSYYRDAPVRRATPTATCSTRPGVARPSGVTVNVYNATDRSGLAAKTAAEVRKRGFKVSTVANDPLQKTVTGTAEVRYGKSGAAGSRLVLRLVKGAKAVRDSRTDSSVDLVLGNRFTALARPAKTTPASSPTTTTC